MPAYEHPALAALDDLEDLLDAYAEARFAPAGPLLARMRQAVVAEAAAAAATAAAERRLLAPDEDQRAQPRWLPRVRMPRPVFAAGFAALLTLGTGAAVIAAPPGSPFYNARVAIEGLLLPAEIDARLAAHEEHLEARLEEAAAAAARGDAQGLAAALAAYEAEMGQAIAEVGDNAAWLAELEAILGKHVAVLETLQARLPEQAAIEKALENSQKAIGKIKEKAAGPRGEPPAGPPDQPPSGPQNQPPGRP